MYIKRFYVIICTFRLHFQHSVLKNDKSVGKLLALVPLVGPATPSCCIMSCPVISRVVVSLQANSELGGIWSVGQRIWQRDFPGIYTTISAHQWSEAVQPIMDALRGDVFKLGSAVWRVPGYVEAEGIYSPAALSWGLPIFQGCRE